MRGHEEIDRFYFHKSLLWFFSPFKKKINKKFPPGYGIGYIYICIYMNAYISLEYEDISFSLGIFFLSDIHIMYILLAISFLLQTFQKCVLMVSFLLQIDVNL